MAPLRKNPERRADSNQRIIQAAMELFAEKGYQRTTLIQIGQRAGFTGTLVSNRFGSKERVLRAVLAQILNRFEGREDAPTPPDKNVAGHLSRFVAMYLNDVAEQGARIQALYVLMGEALGALPEISEEIVKVNTVFREEISGILQVGIENGEFNKNLDADLSATMIVGLLRGIAMQFLTEPDNLDLNSLIAQTQHVAHKIVT